MEGFFGGIWNKLKALLEMLEGTSNLVKGEVIE